MTSADDFTPQQFYEPLEEVERLENYRLGGYHPVQIGDRFHGRYRILHKLSYGSYPLCGSRAMNNSRNMLQ